MDLEVLIHAIDLIRQQANTPEEAEAAVKALIEDNQGSEKK